MIYRLRYNSKTNGNKSVNIIYNTTNKLFYVWKMATFKQQKYLKVLDGAKDCPLFDMKPRGDVAEFINTMRKDKNFTEV